MNSQLIRENVATLHIQWPTWECAVIRQKTRRLINRQQKLTTSSAGFGTKLNRTHPVITVVSPIMMMATVIRKISRPENFSLPLTQNTRNIPLPRSMGEESAHTNSHLLIL